ncbi:hypothetical protein TFLX_01025 [Thermoflexales bacterium]|nr:hypothetical protein TFLX_01025 [Thermoflexales bacterium]
MSEKSDSELNDELRLEGDLRKLLKDGGRDKYVVSGDEDMAVSAITELIPLHVDADDVIRVSGTRVTLDTLVAAFSEGATAEEIAQQYPTLKLADVYSVIGYYLRHPAETQTYLQQRQQRAEAARQQNESRFDPAGIRERLLSRRVR